MGRIGDATDIMVLAGLGYLLYKVRAVSAKGKVTRLIPSIPIQGYHVVMDYLNTYSYRTYQGVESPREY